MNPGSDEAVAAGCRCPIMDNGHGNSDIGNLRGWIINEHCPIHGPKHVTVTQHLEDEREAREALSWRPYSAALGNIKAEARRYAKYGTKASKEEMAENFYSFILDELHDAGWEE